jgi:hypothetical protein
MRGGGLGGEMKQTGSDHEQGVVRICAGEEHDSHDASRGLGAGS